MQILRHDSRRVQRQIAAQPRRIASFGEGADGEAYLCVFDGWTDRLEGTSGP